MKTQRFSFLIALFWVSPFAQAQQTRAMGPELYRVNSQLLKEGSTKADPLKGVKEVLKNLNQGEPKELVVSACGMDTFVNIVKGQAPNGESTCTDEGCSDRELAKKLIQRVVKDSKNFEGCRREQCDDLDNVKVMQKFKEAMTTGPTAPHLILPLIHIVLTNYDPTQAPASSAELTKELVEISKRKLSSIVKGDEATRQEKMRAIKLLYKYDPQAVRGDAELINFAKTLQK